MNPETQTHEIERQAVEQIQQARDQVRAELAKVIVGQEEVIEQLLIALLAGGTV